MIEYWVYMEAPYAWKLRSVLEGVYVPESNQKPRPSRMGTCLGLDIKNVQFVVNYDAPSNLEAVLYKAVRTQQSAFEMCPTQLTCSLCASMLRLTRTTCTESGEPAERERREMRIHATRAAEERLSSLQKLVLRISFQGMHAFSNQACTIPTAVWQVRSRRFS